MQPAHKTRNHQSFGDRALRALGTEHPSLGEKAPKPSRRGLSYPVKLHVEATGVADGLALGVPAPQGGGGGVAVGAGQAEPP